MKVLCYSPVSEECEARLKRGIEALVPREDIQTCRPTEALASRLREPRDEPSAAILLDPTRDGLCRLLSIRDLLGSAALILILPDRQEDTVRTGRLLRPRFMSHVGEDPKEFFADLEKLLRTRETDTISAVHRLPEEKWTLGGIPRVRLKRGAVPPGTESGEEAT